MPKRAIVIDETDNRYGALLVIDRAGNSKRQDATWRCKCNCGKETFALGNNLRRGRTRSCGCGHKKMVHKLPFGVSAFRAVLRQMKRDAKKRKYTWRLSNAETKYLIDSTCYYCGKPPSNICKTDRGNGYYHYNGIDRKNNMLGYIKSNVVTCCFECNRAKGRRSEKEFMDWIDKIIAFRTKEKILIA